MSYLIDNNKKCSDLDGVIDFVLFSEKTPMIIIAGVPYQSIFDVEKAVNDSTTFLEGNNIREHDYDDTFSSKFELENCEEYKNHAMFSYKDAEDFEKNQSEGLEFEDPYFVEWYDNALDDYIDKQLIKIDNSSIEEKVNFLISRGYDATFIKDYIGYGFGEKQAADVRRYHEFYELMH